MFIIKVLNCVNPSQYKTKTAVLTEIHKTKQKMTKVHKSTPTEGKKTIQITSRPQDLREMEFSDEEIAMMVEYIRNQRFVKTEMISDEEE